MPPLAPDEPGAGPLQGVRILLLEDDPDCLEMTAVYLRGAGAQVATAANGQEAVDSYSAERPDVVVADILLPEVDGHAVVRYLRHRGMKVPAIAMTALGESDARFKSAQVGFDLHLTKPVSPDVLLRAIVGLLPPKR